MGVVRPRLGTTPIASGLQSLVRRVMTSASWLMLPATGPGTTGVWRSVSSGQGRASGWPSSGRRRSRAGSRAPRGAGNRLHRLAGAAAGAVSGDRRARRGCTSRAMTMPRLAARASSPGPQYHPVMGAVAPVLRICGREAEIQALGEALGRVAAGGPAIVLVEGEAGIGKTRLLAQALEDARGRGMQVAAGRAEELERTRPFGVLAAAFGCTRSAPDPRRAAIAGAAGRRGAGSDHGDQRPRPAVPRGRCLHRPGGGAGAGRARGDRLG